MIVGADRIAANGDVANKIGTYTLAVLCKENGIPFYVAAPTSTIDLSLASGAEIPIEERSSRRGDSLGGPAHRARGRRRRPTRPSTSRPLGTSRPSSPSRASAGAVSSRPCATAVAAAGAAAARRPAERRSSVFERKNLRRRRRVRRLGLLQLLGDVESTPSRRRTARPATASPSARTRARGWPFCRGTGLATATRRTRSTTAPTSGRWPTLGRDAHPRAERRGQPAAARQARRVRGLRPVRGPHLRPRGDVLRRAAGRAHRRRRAVLSRAARSLPSTAGRELGHHGPRDRARSW